MQHLSRNITFPPQVFNIMGKLGVKSQKNFGKWWENYRGKFSFSYSVMTIRCCSPPLKYAFFVSPPFSPRPHVNIFRIFGFKKKKNKNNSFYVFQWFHSRAHKTRKLGCNGELKMQKEKLLSRAKQFPWACSRTMELIFTQLWSSCPKTKTKKCIHGTEASKVEV